VGCNNSDSIDKDVSVSEETVNHIDHADKVYVTLSGKNNYTDQFSKGSFTRSKTSGPGTGMFTGKEFEFAKGSCRNLDPKWLEKYGWRSQTLGCSGMLLKSDWCARLKKNNSVKYTLRFQSWTIGPPGPRQKCKGRCEENNNKTSYIRIKEAVSQ